ncbi:hypothetical protein HYALB_00008125 [Hymenoscyphus albidus]|uniref:NAD-dependent epimerase/dehydratase domain-containing protein n=1 Tax=Hymenoscyphus albidus TaxID=595503 RepID=A0A9N9PXV0_9HELO|nr:hypothetical protein HYALB_00008125 [Hymenoscyphus albidus]
MSTFENFPLDDSFSISSSSPISRTSTPATVHSGFSETNSRTSPASPSDELILVVGGLGYIGSHTSWELLKTGQNVIIIDNNCHSELSVLDKLDSLVDSHYKLSEAQPILDFYQVDYRDQEQMTSILSKYRNAPDSATKSKITGVIHFAAYKSVAESFKKPLQYYSNNVAGLVDFCTILGDVGIKNLIFSSSATVYGELASQGSRLTESMADNSSCHGLTNPYGRTKWVCEAILNDLASSDNEWNITALRYFNPIGADESGVLGEDPSGENLMPIVVKAMSGKLEALSVFGTNWDTPDGTAIRDFIHVSDLAMGHLAALKKSTGPDAETGYHVFNLGSGTGNSVMDIVSSMREVSGKAIPIVEKGRREGDVGVCIAEPSKSWTQLGWKTEKSLKTACYDVCRYLGYVS